MTPRWVEPVTLTGRRVRMEPLSLERHWDGLRAFALDLELWRWTITKVDNEQDLRRYVDTAVRELAEGRSLPFATIDVASGRVAGCTRFGSLEPHHRRVEIGWTMVAPEFQRSHVNTEAKYLMLCHAFETLNCVRVEFRAHASNDKSRRAMERIGASYEGMLRRHMLREHGDWRDTVYYSVLDSEWPTVRAKLEVMIARSE